MHSAPDDPGGSFKEIYKLPYFVSTLHQAQLINSKCPHGIITINQLLDERAKSDPELPVVGMGVPGLDQDGWGSKIYTFADLSRISNIMAHKLVREGIVPPVSEETTGKLPPTAAILSQSSLELLMTFLGLSRIGYTVLLIAPQCTQRAISHLLNATEATHMFHSPSLTDPATSSEPESCKDHIIPEIPQLSEVEPYPTPREIDGSTVAYIHHTSGTSTGLPKPIPHTHAAATSYLPYLPPPLPQAAFTTTPLYHGGTADLMRSLMSSSMIWLYPPCVPVTSGNILNILDVADRSGLPVKLFTAVPYVFEVCVGNEEVLKRMVGMEIVGVGGAPLGSELGSILVKRGVRLVSRFGSSECGFLMSSYRDFAMDNNWEYLRIPPDCKSLHFEQNTHTGGFELIVLPGWPQIAKPNRLDGSYATGDLFTPHPDIKRAYKYQGRNDATIVLSNGKKFDPTAIEEAFKEFDLVREAIVFGNNRAFPGALIFMAVRRLALGGIKELVKRVNGRTHWKIMEEMIVVMCADEGPPINSKGTVMRGVVDEMFREEIDQVYHGFESHEVEGKIEIADARAVKDAVHLTVKDITGKVGIMEDTDLFTDGVDSVMAAQIRNRLIKNLEISKPLPLNVVFEQRTIGGLARFITAGGEVNGGMANQQLELMLHMVEKYGDFGGAENQSVTNTAASNNEHVVVLTGATGALGAHILHQLCNSRNGIKKVVCLCRAKDHEDPRVRVQESLRARKLPFLEGSGTDVMMLEVQLGDDHLGLNETIYDQLKREATLVIHAAWEVNFLASLESFERDHIAGIRNLINLTLGSSHFSRFFFCSSTAAVLGNVEPYATIKEKFTDDPRTAAPLGYGRSKWVAEKICQKLNGRAGVLRIGQLCGDTKGGVWNETEAWPLMFASANTVGCLPELNETLSWLPVDIAAEVVLDITLGDHLWDASREPVFHVVNTDTSTSWGSVLSWIEELGIKFSRVSPSQWVKALSGIEDGEEDPSRKLLGLWESKYGEEINSGSGDEANFTFDVGNTVAFSDALGGTGEWKINKKYVQRIWRSWEQSGFVRL